MELIGLSGATYDCDSFVGDNDEMLWVQEADVVKTLNQARELYDDFCVIKGKRYACPPTFNRLTFAWYLNEPSKGDPPNVGCTDAYNFYALRDIARDEELTIDYSLYRGRPSVAFNSPRKKR